MPSRKRAPAKERAGKKSATRKRRGGNTITVDFTNVESGGGMPTPDGYYTAEIKHILEQVGGESGEPYLAVRWKTHIGSTVFDNFSLQPQSLWVLRTCLECMGYDIPDSEYDFDPDDLLGETCGLEIINEEYDGKDRPKVGGYMLVDVAEGDELYVAGGGDRQEEEDGDDGVEEEEEEQTPPPKAKRAPKKKAAAKKKATAIRPGARVTFEGEDEEEVLGVVESIDDDIATVVDDEDGEWEIPVDELTKA